MEADLRVGRLAGLGGGVGVFEVRGEKTGVSKVVMVVGGVSKQVGQEVAKRLEGGLGRGGGAVFEVLRQVMELLEGEFPGINLVVGVWWREVIYVAVVGVGGGYLLREGDEVELVVGRGDGGVKMVSGHWREGDRVALAVSLFVGLVRDRGLRWLVGGRGERIEERLKKEVGEVQGALATVEVRSQGLRAGSQKEVGRGGQGGLRMVKIGRWIFRGRDWMERSWEGLRRKGVGGLTIFKGMLEGLVEWLVRRLPGKENVYVIDEIRARRGRKVALVVGVGVLVALVISVVGGVRERRRRELEERWEQVAEEVKYRLDEGRVLAELNPARARVLLGEAQKLLDEVGDEEGVEGKAKMLSEELGRVLGAALGEHQVKGDLWFELSLVGEGVRGDEWIAEGGKLWVWDRQEGRVVVVDTETKAAEVVWGGEEVRGMGGVTVNQKEPLGLRKEGVVGRKGVVVEKDEEWGEMGGLAAYGGNLYLLDKGRGMIWRYPVIEGGGFGGKQRWLVREADFSGAVGMIIDGAIWVAESKDVRKFVLGTEENFKVSGLERPWGEIEDIYTGVDREGLYVLDKGEGRVVVINKESGEYEEQYEWERMKEVSKIAVDDEERRLFLLLGEEIYVIGLK